MSYNYNTCLTAVANAIVSNSANPDLLVSDSICPYFYIVASSAKAAMDRTFIVTSGTTYALPTSEPDS
jgi:hypothetical protein